MKEGTEEAGAGQGKRKRSEKARVLSVNVIFAVLRLLC